MALADGGRVAGRIAYVTPDTLALNLLRYRSVSQPVTVTETFPTDSIARVWVASGTHWKTGALVGALVGVSTTLTLWSVLRHDRDLPPCDAGCLTGALIGSGLGGAGVGATIGLFYLKWRVVF